MWQNCTLLRSELKLPPGYSFRWLSGQGDPARLPAIERQQALAIGHGQRKNQFVIGRLVARALLSDLMNVKPDAVPLTIAPDGGLDVGRAPYCVSIAHTGAIAVAAAGPGPVGIDIEQVRERREGLLERILSAEEQVMVGNLPLDASRRVLISWTAKEAALKAFRTGLRRSMKDLTLEIAPAVQTGLCSGLNRRSLRLSFAERANHIIAAAMDFSSQDP